MKVYEAEGMINSNEAFSQFRQELHAHLNNRADATMDLPDAPSGNTEARTPVELNPNPLFRRHYSALARPLAQAQLRPWERYLPNVRLRPLTPTLVQRSLAQMIRRFGTPARSPKPRGDSKGRRKGVRLTSRPRLSVVRKRPKRPG